MHGVESERCAFLTVDYRKSSSPRANLRYDLRHWIKKKIPQVLYFMAKSEFAEPGPRDEQEEMYDPRVSDESKKLYANVLMRFFFFSFFFLFFFFF